METVKVLNNVSGAGASPSYFIDGSRHGDETEVQVFLSFAAGTVTVEASADNVLFSPIKDGQFTSSEVVPIDLADGSYLRVSYTGASALHAIIKPKNAIYG